MSEWIAPSAAGSMMTCKKTHYLWTSLPFGLRYIGWIVNNKFCFSACRRLDIRELLSTALKDQASWLLGLAFIK